MVSSADVWKGFEINSIGKDNRSDSNISGIKEVEVVVSTKGQGRPEVIRVFSQPLSSQLKFISLGKPTHNLYFKILFLREKISCDQYTAPPESS